LIVVDGNVEPFAKMVAVVFCLEILVNGGNITLGKYGTKESIDHLLVTMGETDDLTLRRRSVDRSKVNFHLSRML
jgi:hypothetical protein